jgi:hypothetical protein
MANNEFHGNSYIFGFQSTDAPTITGFSARKAELTFEPEIFVQATDGEGLTEAVALTKATHRKITGTFTGYIQTGYSANSIANTFNFDVNSVSRYFIVKSISDPRNKGEYAEVSLTVESYALVTGAAV